jgi:branched-chain amino acid transport system ATP-binding protein
MDKKKIRGYGEGKADTVVSVDEVHEQSSEIKQEVSQTVLLKLSNNSNFLEIKNLNAGYGKMEILHDFNLTCDKGQSLCLIGPNGAGKSTVLHSIYGFTNIYSGDVIINNKNVTALSPAEKLKSAGVAYILQDNSVFPDMTVEENLLMGGFIKDNSEQSQEAANNVLKKYTRLSERRNQKAKVLSGGERRLLEISRALIMNPEILLVDEPSIGLEPKYIDMVFEILGDLQKNDKKTIVLVEQNAKKGLEFSDIGYVLVSGQTAIAGKGDELLNNPDVGRLFLGG